MGSRVRGFNSALSTLTMGTRRAAAVTSTPNLSSSIHSVRNVVRTSRLPLASQQRRLAASGAAVEEKEPEYASGDLKGYQVFHQASPFKLRNGNELPELRIAYETWGQINEDRSNVILLQTGMSASSHACSNVGNTSPGWWEDFIGEGKPLDTSIFHIICTNNLGGCYGSTGPSSPHPEDGKPWGSRFPRFDVYDQVAAQFLLLDHLGIKKVHACVGSSLGGMQSVCSAGSFPERVGKIVSISACAKSFPGSIAFRHAQRQAIRSDPNWNQGNYYDGQLPAAGLTLAREIGTITYRSGQEWQQRFGQRRKGTEVPQDLEHEFHIEHYLAHQGVKWVNNYDPNSMLWISKAMDSFTMEKPDVEGNPSLVEGLADAMQPALVIGVQHDVLFPCWQQKEIADTLRKAGNKRVTYYELDSVYGHDSFLLDAVAIGPAVKGHLEQEPGGAAHLWKEQAMLTAKSLGAHMSRSSTADSMRDLFRSVADGSQSVPREQLLRLSVLLFQNKFGVSQTHVEKVFSERLPPMVTLDEFLSVREEMERGTAAAFDI